MWDEGLTAAIDAAFANDPNQDADTLTYEWDLDGDGIFGETDQNAEFGIEVGLATFFSAPEVDGDASQTISLRVTDDFGMSSIAQAVVNVRNVAPVVESQTFFVDEGTNNGAFVGNVVARDVPVDALTYAAVGGSGLSSDCN